MKRFEIVFVLLIAVGGTAQAAPRLSTEIWPEGRYNLDYCKALAQKRGYLPATVPAGGVLLKMDVRSRELMRRFGISQPGWPEFVAAEGELVYGSWVGEDAEYKYFSVRYFARADCRNATQGRIKYRKARVAQAPVAPGISAIVEIGSKVYLYASDRTVIEHRVEAAPPPEQRLLISLAPAQDQKAEFQKGSAQFSPQNAVIGLLPRARLSASGGSGGSASAASSSSSAASTAAASDSGGELAPPPANAPVDAAGAGPTPAPRP